MLTHTLHVARRDQPVIAPPAPSIDLRVACDAVPQIVWITASDGTLAYTNARFLEYTGPERTGATDPILHSVHPAERDVLRTNWAAALAAGKAHEATFRLRRHDGVYRWHLARSAPLRGEAGSIASWLWTATDIDDLRRSEETVRERELRLRDVVAKHRFQAQLLEAVQQAVVATDPAGHVLSWNAGAENLYGWSADEALGRSLADLVVPVSEPTAVVSGRGRPHAAQMSEQRIRRKDGTEIWISLCTVPILDTRGVASHIVAAATDITERRALEDRFRHAQKMEAIGRLAGGIAHDFNNLLTVITASAEFVSAALPADDDARTDIDEIARAAHRAARLTRQLLAFSRQQVLDRKVIDLNATIAQLETMLGRLIGEDINLHLSLDPKAPLVLADESQLEQSVANLVVNARDAMPAGGTLRIATRLTVVEPDDARRHDVEPGQFASVVVQDAGIGMSRDVLERIFEPFFTTKESGRGTGLGLATVYGIVRQLGGFVTVRSEPGLGSTFTILIPATGQRKTPETEEPVVQPVAGREETILVVEDQPEVRAVVCRILSKNGYRVLAARDAVEAMLHLGTPAVSIDLLLTDAVMPGTGGPELVRAVRAARPGIPCIIMSGYSDDHRTDGLRGDPRIEFLCKPLRTDRLLQVVRTMIAATDPPMAATPLPAPSPQPLR